MPLYGSSQNGNSSKTMVFLRLKNRLILLVTIFILAGSFVIIPGAYKSSKSTLLSSADRQPLIIDSDVRNPHKPSPITLTMSRKTPSPVSWLDAIRDAEVAFLGEANLLEDTAVTASETSFRGAGYRLTAEIDIQNLLFGSISETSITWQGETSRSPDHRLTQDSSLFPPDTLNQIPYWEYARMGPPQPVLGVLSEPILIIYDPDATLPEAVSLIKSWLVLSSPNVNTQVIESLTASPQNPIAYIAGFELLLEQQQMPVSDLFTEFNTLPDRPSDAIKGIVDKLYLVANGLGDDDIRGLAQKLLDAWSEETSPAAICSYLTWFDAHKHRTWETNDTLRKAVLEQAERSRSMPFSSAEQADAWTQRVQHYASRLLHQ